MKSATTLGLMEYQAQDQQDPLRRMCGAAALAMVYRSFGVADSQAEIWPQISRRDDRGSWNAATYLLGKAAHARGLDAVVVQAGRPWEMLQRATQSPWRVILNHRLEANSPRGHFSVLVDADHARAVVHDPQFGPHREFSRDELLNLWRPVSSAGEVTGYVLVAIGSSNGQAENCGSCGAALPRRRLCSVCGGVLLFPQSILGCVDTRCSERLWARIFCPQCDASSIHIEGRPKAAASG